MKCSRQLRLVRICMRCIAKSKTLIEIIWIDGKTIPHKPDISSIFSQTELEAKVVCHMVYYTHVPDPFACQAKLQDEIEQLLQKSGERRAWSEQNKNSDVTPDSVGDGIVL